MPGPPRLDLVHKAIRAGTLGNIEWEPSALQRMLEDPTMEGVTAFGVRLLLREFVSQGSCLDVRDQKSEQHLEERPEHPYWYRAIIPVPQFPKGLFVETILIDPEEEEEPFVQIVSAHRQL